MKQKIIRNNIIPFNGFLAINLFGIIFLRNHIKLSKNKFETMVNHESIHTKQMKELFYILFYLWYLIEFIIRFFTCGNSKQAYKNICFEREAYLNQNNKQYIGTRKKFNFLKYYRISEQSN